MRLKATKKDYNIERDGQTRRTDQRVHAQEIDRLSLSKQGRKQNIFKLGLVTLRGLNSKALFSLCKEENCQAAVGTIRRRL